VLLLLARYNHLLTCCESVCLLDETKPAVVPIIGVRESRRTLILADNRLSPDRDGNFVPNVRLVTFKLPENIQRKKKYGFIRKLAFTWGKLLVNVFTL